MKKVFVLWFLLAGILITGCSSLFPKHEILTVEQQKKNIERCGINKSVAFYLTTPNYMVDEYYQKYKCYLNASDGTFTAYDPSKYSEEGNPSDLCDKVYECFSGKFYISCNNVLFLKIDSIKDQAPPIDYGYSVLFDGLYDFIKKYTTVVTDNEKYYDTTDYYIKNNEARLSFCEEGFWNLNQIRISCEEQADGIHCSVSKLPPETGEIRAFVHKDSSYISAYWKNITGFSKSSYDFVIPFMIAGAEQKVYIGVYMKEEEGNSSLNPDFQSDFILSGNVIEKTHPLLQGSVTVKNDSENEKIYVTFNNFPEKTDFTNLWQADLKFSAYPNINYGCSIKKDDLKENKAEFSYETLLYWHDDLSLDQLKSDENILYRFRIATDMYGEQLETYVLNNYASTNYEYLEVYYE